MKLEIFLATSVRYIAASITTPNSSFFLHIINCITSRVTQIVSMETIHFSPKMKFIRVLLNGPNSFDIKKNFRLKVQKNQNIKNSHLERGVVISLSSIGTSRSFGGWPLSWWPFKPFNFNDFVSIEMKKIYMTNIKNLYLPFKNI